MTRSITKLLILTVFLLTHCCNLYGQLSGNYTIDATGTSSSNYRTIGAAVSDLNNNGVSGNVKFTLAKGTYRERVVIPPISGANSSSTITFDGQYRDSVLITYSSSSSGSRATWHFDGADYIKVENLTIEATGTFRSSVHFSDRAEYNVVNNCLLKAQGSSTDHRNVVFASDTWAGGNHGNYNTISKSVIDGGYYGIFNYGTGLSTLNNNSSNYFIDIDIVNVTYYGMYNYYTKDSYFKNLKIKPTYTYGYPIYNYYAYGNRVDSCVLDGGSYGLYDYFSKYNVFRKNVIKNQRDHNVYCYYSEQEVFQKNELRNPYYYNLYTYAATDLKLLGNYFEGGTRYSLYNWASYNGERDSVAGNYFTKADYYNLLIYNNSNSIFVNNIINGQLPGKNYFESNFYLFQGDGVKIYNNTFYNKGGGGTYQGTFAYTVPNNFFNYSSSKTDLRNNIFEYDGAFKDAANICNYNGSFAFLNSNNYQSTQVVYVDDKTVFSSLNNWFANQNYYNAQSHEETNYFVEKDSGDFHLSSKYPGLLGVGINRLLRDFDNDTRCSYGPTIGADESLYPVSKLDADFVTGDTVYLNGPTYFLNKNSDKMGSEHNWWVNGSWQASSPNFEYTFTKAGFYYVKLLSFNCGGLDSITKRVYADTSRKAPQADFVLSATEIDAKQEVSATDLSIDGPDKWTWQVSPDSIFDPQYNAIVSRITYTNSTTVNSRNPKFTLNYPGVYTITLKAENVVGSSTVTKKDVIIVRAVNQMCFFPNYTNIPSGTLFDQGGVLGDYSNNSNCGFLIDPCAKEVTLNFKSFELEPGYDFIRIYDGKDNLGKPLWDISVYGGDGITGNISDIGFDSSYTAKSGKMYIEMTTDPYNALSGFIADWTSIPGNFKAPNAVFSAPDTVCVNQEFAFENLSTGAINDYLWNFGVNKKSTSVNQSPSFKYTSPGRYKVVLQASGCNDTDTMQKTIVADYPSSLPVGYFYADLTRPAKTELVQLIPETKNCVNKHYWLISPTTGYAYVNNTNDSSQFPQIVFSDTGRYDVRLVIKNIAASDTIYKPNYIQVVNYCIPTVTNRLSDLGISKVVLEGKTKLEHISTSDENAYSNYTANSADIEVGYDYELTIERTSNSNKVRRAVWIDWNQNGDFESSELIGQEAKGGTNNLSYTFKFKVPVTARVGGTRMRVSSALGVVNNSPCGNQAYGEFEDYRVFIEGDKTIPQITLNGKDTVYVNECYTYNEAGATVCDNIAGCGLLYNISDTVNTSLPGTYKLKYNAKDTSGNWAKQVVRTVIVQEDIVAPSVSLIGADSVYIDVYSSYTENGIIALDSCGVQNISIVGRVDTSVIGEYTINYFASDNSNSANKQRVVFVEDNESPKIDLNGQDTVKADVFEVYNEKGAVYTDNYYKPNELQVEERNNVNTNEIGTYYAYYNAKDPSGNVSKQMVRVVNVVDRLAPEIYLKGPDTVVIEVGYKLQDLMAGAYDLLDGDMGLPTLGGDFYRNFPNARPTEIGDFTAQYTFTDKSGNADSVARTIIVVDKEEPYILLKGGQIVELCRWQDFIEPGYEVSDNYDKAPIVVKDESKFNSQSIGQYTITYYAEDQSGNKSEVVSRRISVVDCANSLDENDENNAVVVFPNPNNGEFTLEHDIQGLMLNQVELYTIQGVRIYDCNILEQSSTSVGFDITSHAKGIYFVKLLGKNGSRIVKVTYQ